MAINEDGIVAEVTCSTCPVQIEGTADGMHLYFREDGGWTFGIGATLNEAVNVSLGWFGARHFRREGDEGDGYMPHAEAWDIVRRCVREWRAERAAAGGE